MTWTRRQKRLRKILNKENYFEDVVELIQSKLSDAQLRRIQLTDKGETYDLWEQIFLRCVDNRYCLPAQKTEILERVESFLNKYTFLLNSNLDDERVRHIFMQSLMECISIGSGLFFAKEDCYCIEVAAPNWSATATLMLWRLRKYCRLRFRKHFCKVMQDKYPSIPNTDICRRCVEIGKPYDWKTFTLFDMMSISYSYPIWKSSNIDAINFQKFIEELVRRLRWCLESLNQCSSIFVNKYKDRVFRELSSALGMDTDRAYFIYLTFLREPEGEQYKRKNDLSEFIVSLFTEEELQLLELKDAQGNDWTFQKQIKDRHYSKYPSFAARKEIEENISKKVEGFRPLLNAETAEVIRDILFDEIERECFVSRDTYLWNQEMKGKIKEVETLQCNDKVVKAIDFLISIIPTKAVKELSVEKDGRVFSLREQLLARWNRAWFVCSLKNFQEYLSQMHIHTPYNLKFWRDKEVVSRTDLQAFLEEIDMFFIYPQRWRIIKKLLFRLDNGRVVGYRNIGRVKMAQRCDAFERFWWKRSGLMVIFFIVPMFLFIYLR